MQITCDSSPTNDLEPLSKVCVAGGVCGAYLAGTPAEHWVAEVLRGQGSGILEGRADERAGKSSYRSGGGR